jgi:lactate dehydrogenase-like 2-hydroxyacid dehydrogenase
LGARVLFWSRSRRNAASGHLLLRSRNVVGTPHLAWLTRETLQRSIDAALKNLDRCARAFRWRIV